MSQRPAVREMDDSDRRILECLREDGRMPNTRIAERVGVTERTVRKRIQRMVDEQGLRILPVVDPDYIGLDTCVYVGFNVAKGHLKEVTEKVSSMPEVRYLAHMAGPWDLLAEAFVGSREHLADFVLTEIGELEGVTHTETFHVLRIEKFGYEWEVPDTSRHGRPRKSIAHPSDSKT